MTTDSPCCTGMVDTRTSMLRLRTRMLKRPSCGRRFSEISSPDMIFRRITRADATRCSFITCSLSTPSIRWRIRTTPSSGSMWMSEAFICTASSNSVCSRRTTGASEVLSAPSLLRSKSLSCSEPSSSPASEAISLVRRYRPSRLESSSLSRTTAGCTRVFRTRSSSSRANRSSGSLMPTSRPPPSRDSTMARKRRAMASGRLCTSWASSLKCLSSIKGMRSCSDSAVSSCTSLTKPRSTTARPSLAPLIFWLCRACCSCSSLISPACTSRSPRRTLR